MDRLLDGGHRLLEGMRECLEKAKDRLVKAQQGFQLAQAELGSATAEYNIWNSAINLAVRDEEKRLAESREKQIPMNLPDLQTAIDVEESADSTADDVTEAIQSAAVTNKTQKVRDILRAHESGITAGGIWEEVKDHISSRAYLYAILKRLRDNDEACMRRGKYLPKTKSFEVKAAGTEAITVQ
jgi:hypothetical protein